MSPIILTLEWLTKFAHFVQFFSNACHFGVHLWATYHTHHLSVGVHLRWVIELGSLTLIESKSGTWNLSLLSLESMWTYYEFLKWNSKMTYHSFLSDICISDLHMCKYIGHHCRSLQITCTHVTPSLWIPDISTEVVSMVYFKRVPVSWVLLKWKFWWDFYPPG